MVKITNEFIEACLELSDNEHSKIGEREVELYGLTSKRVKAFINNICSKPKTKYLELGVYKGSTILSALLGNPELTAIGVDNFKYDDREPKKVAPEGYIWENMKSQLFANIARYKDQDSKVNTDNLSIIESDWSSLDWSSIKDVDVTFIDLTPTNKDTYTKLLPKVIESSAANAVLVFSQYSNQETAKVIDEVVATLSSSIDIVGKYVRTSNGLSDATKYYSGLLILNIKKQQAAKATIAKK